MVARRGLIMVLSVVAVLAPLVAGCGGGGGEGGGDDAERRVKFGDFSLVLPAGSEVAREGDAPAGRPGDRYWKISFPSGGSLLVYRTGEEVPLELQDVVDLAVLAGGLAQQAGSDGTIDIRSYERTSLGGVKGLVIAGRWKDGEIEAEARYIGLGCGSDFYLLRALHPPEWDEALQRASSTFRCKD